MVLIDGCNVGYGHSHHNSFSVRGVQICLEMMERLGHKALAVVPQRRLCPKKVCLKLVNNNLKTNRQHTNNSDPALLNELHRQDRVLFSPFDNKYGVCTAQYDDRCTLDLAVRNDAAIITNDNFRDLINENAGKMLHLK